MTDEEQGLFHRFPQCRSCHREGENVETGFELLVKSTADNSPLTLIHFYF